MTGTRMQRAAAAAWLVLLTILAGCAAPASRESMSATVVVAKKFPYSVSVATAGGSETDNLGSSNVSDAELKSAIEASITQSGLFKAVVQGRGGDYDLTVTIASVNKPIFGASFTVTMETTWVLVRTSDKAAVLRKAITSSNTATMGDSLVGVTRLRLALEGAARKNIADGLQAIAALNL